MILATALAAMVVAAAPEGEIGAKSSTKAMQSLNAIGKCVAAEHSGATKALLAMDFRDSGYGKAMRKLLDKPAACRHLPVSRGAHVSGGLLWGGALAEGLLERDGTLDRLGEATAYQPGRPSIEARNAGELMALCVVRANPVGVAALLGGEPGTGEEYQSIKALATTLSACVPANSKSEFTRESLRALIALGAYRLAVHNAEIGTMVKEAVK